MFCLPVRALAPLAFTVLVACDTPSGTDSLSFADTIDHLLVSSDAGSIHVESSPAVSRIHVEAILYGRGTEVRAATEGSTLVLRPACERLRMHCGVDWHITVPAREAPRSLDLDSGSGDIEVRDMQGTIDAHTGSGDVAVVSVASPVANLDTGSGNVTVESSSIQHLDVHTGSGNIGVNLGEKPSAVALDAGSGDIDLTLPSGDYVLDAESGSGKVSMDRVTPNAAAAERVGISTGSGDVRVRGF